MHVDVVRRLNMTYENSKKNAIDFVKSDIRTQALSQEPKLGFGALDRSTDRKSVV